MSLASTPTQPQRSADGDGGRGRYGESDAMKPEAAPLQTSRPPTRSSYRSTSAIAGATGTSAVTSERSAQLSEAEPADGSVGAVADPTQRGPPSPWRPTSHLISVHGMSRASARGVADSATAGHDSRRASLGTPSLRRQAEQLRSATTSVTAASGVGHRPYQPTSLFGADAAAVTASAASAASSAVLGESPGSSACPLPLRCGSAQAGPAEDPDVLAVATPLPTARVRRAVEKTRPSDEEEAAAAAQAPALVAAVTATPRSRRATTDRSSSDVVRSAAATRESDSRSPTTATTKQQQQQQQQQQQELSGHREASAAMLVAVPSATTPELHSAEAVLQLEPASAHGAVEEDRSLPDLRLFSSTATPSMRLARYGGASDTEQRSGDGKSADVSHEDVMAQRRRQDQRTRLASGDSDGAARAKESDSECITMSCLIAHVAVPPSVQVVLHNPDATVAELWTALRTACQQCEVLQRRLARAEGTLDEEDEYNRPGVESGAASWRRRSSTDAAGPPANSPRPHGTVPSLGGRRPSHLSHRARDRVAEAGAAAVPAPATVVAAAAPAALDGSSQIRGGGVRSSSSGADVSQVLRHRVSEAIRRAEAERKTPAHAAHAVPSPERHGASPEGRSGDTPPSQRPPQQQQQPDVRGSPRSTTPSDGQPRREAQRGRAESRSPPPTVSAARRLDSARGTLPTVSVSSSASVDADAAASPLSSNGDAAVTAHLPTLPSIAAQSPATRRSGLAAEGIHVAHPPSPPRSCRAGSDAAPPPRRRHRAASLVSLESAPILFGDGARVGDGVAVAVAESLGAWPAAATSLPAGWPHPTAHGPPHTHGSPTRPTAAQQQQQQQAWGPSPASVTSTPTAVVAALATPLTGTLPSLLSSTLSARQAASISSVESSRWRQQQQQQQHASFKGRASVSAPSRPSDDTHLPQQQQQQQSGSPRSRSPSVVALSATSMTLEMLKQIHNDDPPVPPACGDDEKVALRQWRREAAKVGASGAAPIS